MLRRKIGILFCLLLLAIALLSKSLLLKSQALQVEPLATRFEKMRSLEVPREKMEQCDRGQSARRFVNELTGNLLYNDLVYDKDAKELLNASLFRKYVGKKRWEEYQDFLATVFMDVKCFPVPRQQSGCQVSYDNSWGQMRSYGGKRTHEGCDIMPKRDVPGVIPVLSVCDGEIENIGWLALGGYRVGIRGKHGGYYYYAHLDSYGDGVKKGQKVKAGQILGYMGDSGYGDEGTTGQFPVHLHFGIYMDYHGEQVSINPYAVLLYLEDRRK